MMAIKPLIPRADLHLVPVVGLEQEKWKPLLRHYSLTTRGVQPQNSRTPIESGTCVRLSSTPLNSG